MYLFPQYPLLFHLGCQPPAGMWTNAPQSHDLAFVVAEDSTIHNVCLSLWPLLERHLEKNFRYEYGSKNIRERGEKPRKKFYFLLILSPDHYSLFFSYGTSELQQINKTFTQLLLLIFLGFFCFLVWVVGVFFGSSMSLSELAPSTLITLSCPQVSFLLSPRCSFTKEFERRSFQREQEKKKHCTEFRA